MKFPETFHVLSSIGFLKTPYEEEAPYQPVQDNTKEFIIELNPVYSESLKGLASFNYCYVIYYLHKALRTQNPTLKPNWAEGYEVGVFASRSPERPNPIGISVVKILSIQNNLIYIDSIDAFNHTPVLDIKPYIDELDAKKDANLGWVEQFDNQEHLALHLKGIPHKH